LYGHLVFEVKVGVVGAQQAKPLAQVVEARLWLTPIIEERNRRTLRRCERIESELLDQCLERVHFATVHCETEFRHVPYRVRITETGVRLVA
jgi:hypothetical protein